MQNYRVKIRTSRGSRLAGINRSERFATCREADVFSFRSSCIVIECKRSHTQRKEEIENNPSSTIRIQILRALLLYYAANVQNARVYRINVSHILMNETKPVSELKYDKKNQPLFVKRDVPKDFILDVNALVNNVFNGGSQNYETILSHWLGSWAVDGRYDIFARLWRCIERLSVATNHVDRLTEKNNLKALRSYILNFPGSFSLSCKHVDTMSFDDFRSFTWKLLIYNNFKRNLDERACREDYRDLFVLPYMDSRVVRMLKDTLVYRISELQRFGYDVDVNTHISGALRQNVKKNEDIVAILCGYYAYFIRNKIFHGEFSERSFNICKTMDDGIIDRLNKLLEILSFELIQVYSAL